MAAVLPCGGVAVRPGEFAYDYDDEHGQGLVTFAGVMLMIVAVLNTLYGIAAIDKAHFFVQDAKYVFGDLNTWGWFPRRAGHRPVLRRPGDLARGAVGSVVRRRVRERQRDLADALDPFISGPGNDDPGPRCGRDLRAAGLRRAPTRGTRRTRAR
jgi:hypothetical protein